MSSRRVLRRFGLLCLAVLPIVPTLLGGSVGCAPIERTSSTSGTSESETRREGRMKLLVTVDWEGRDLAEENLAAMEKLRAEFPAVKIVHFLNAAYFTKPSAVAADVRGAIQRTLLREDELGLHIHGWKRLFEASGVTFRFAPTFWGRSVDPNGPDCAVDCGHDVPINLYTAEELEKVVTFSVDTLEANGFGRARSFRCGGWVASQSVRDGIAAGGIRWDHSEVPTTFLVEEIGSAPLYRTLQGIWPDTTALAEPHVLDVASGTLGEIPDNGALADYVTPDEMLQVFEANKAKFLADRTKNVVVSIGFHQETAARYVPRVAEALRRIHEEAERERLPLDSVTSDDLVAK